MTQVWHEYISILKFSALRLSLTSPQPWYHPLHGPNAVASTEVASLISVWRSPPDLLLRVSSSESHRVTRSWLTLTIRSLVFSLEMSSTRLLPFFFLSPLIFLLSFMKKCMRSSHQQSSQPPLHRGLNKIYFHLRVKSWFAASAPALSPRHRKSHQGCSAVPWQRPCALKETSVTQK